MAEELKLGCARPTGGMVGQGSGENPIETDEKRKEGSTMVQVGRKAPDFTAPGYSKGTFVTVQLSEYAGQWVLLCFYPGDFTFV